MWPRKKTGRALPYQSAQLTRQPSSRDTVPATRLPRGRIFGAVDDARPVRGERLSVPVRDDAGRGRDVGALGDDEQRPRPAAAGGDDDARDQCHGRA